MVKQATEEKQVTDEEFAEGIKSAVISLNHMMEDANERNMAISVTMATLNGRTTPSFRFEYAYKRLDKQLILRP